MGGELPIASEFRSFTPDELMIIPSAFMSKTAFLFAGQGAQVVGMGKDLAAAFPEARNWFDRADQALGYSLSSVCFEGPESELTRTEHAQPGIYLVGWIAFELLKSRVPGICFDATAGLSLGEFTALAAGGCIGFEDGLRVVRLRGQAMQEACEATEGSMAAIIGLDEEPTRQVCVESGVELANLNSPGQIVISGEKGRIAAAIELAKSKGAKRALPLAVAGAYHSRLMAGAQPKLKQALDAIQVQSSPCLVMSNVTGLPHQGAEDIRNRLVEQVTASVRWEACVRWLIAQGFTRFIELGPGTALSGFMKRIDKSVVILNVSDVPSLENAARALSA